MQVNNNNSSNNSCTAINPDLSPLKEIDKYLDMIEPIIEEALKNDKMDSQERSGMIEKLKGYVQVLSELENQVAGKNLNWVRNLKSDIKHNLFDLEIKLTDDPIQKIKGYMAKFSFILNAALDEDTTDIPERDEMNTMLKQFKNDLITIKQLKPNEDLSRLENRIKAHLHVLNHELNIDG